MAYSDEEKENILKDIFDKIEDGKSLRKALKEMPLSSKTFYEWIESDKEKVKQYARATELRADALVDEMIDIADDSSLDIDEYEIAEGVTATRTNHEVIQRSRLRYDARKWLATKLNPKKYGEKIQQELSGEITTNTTQINVEITPPSDVDD